MIGISQVSKVFGSGPTAVAALEKVSLEIPAGGFFTLLGPSGCGKTTLLRLIAGFELPTSGDITLDGEFVGHLPPHHRPVNTVFQNYALFPHMSVTQNVAFGLEMLGQSTTEVSAKVAEMLALVHMENYADRRIDQLSGGQQQRVALARALAPSPKVLLLDEPLSALDLKLRKEMQSELKRLQLETGLTFVFVTHDQGEALAISDQIAVMSQGKVQQIGTPQEIYARPRSRFVADFIGDTNILRADLVECDGDHALVKFDGEAQHRLPLLDFEPVVGPVHVAVHPESLTLTSPDASEAIFQGVVESSTYFGSGSMVHVQLDRGEVISVQVPSKANPGERVGLSAAVSDFQVLVD